MHQPCAHRVPPFMTFPFCAVCWHEALFYHTSHVLIPLFSALENIPYTVIYLNLSRLHLKMIHDNQVSLLQKYMKLVEHMKTEQNGLTWVFLHSPGMPHMCSRQQHFHTCCLFSQQWKAKHLHKTLARHDEEFWSLVKKHFIFSLSSHYRGEHSSMQPLQF